jgi:RNA polymerase sigma factor (sigma-70 family)
VTAASPQEQEPSDAELIAAVREGSAQSYATLYERHRAAAYNLARQLTRSSAEADDLVSESFAELLDTLRSGRGPNTAFRAYLLTTLRHSAYDRTRRERRIELSDDVSAYDTGVPFTDTAIAALDRSLAARAFAQLPERWQAVLWHTEIEGQSSAEIAPLLGLTPNGVSALAYRAREGLRQAYLQAHLADVAAAGGGHERCQAAIDRLGAWIRDGLSRRDTAQVERHLDDCARCRALAAELADVNGELRAFVAPLVLGTATAVYLAACGMKAATAAGMTGVAGTGAAGEATAAGGAGNTGGIGSGGQRQFLTAAGSVTALVAALVAGLLAGPMEPARPRAAPVQPSVVPAVPSPQPPVSPPPTPPATDSAQPPTDEPGAEPVPGSPAPAPPALEASAPAGTIELVAGGAPMSLPVTVRNTGGSRSEPVGAWLDLPPGVTAVGSGSLSPSGPAVTTPQSTSFAAMGAAALSAQVGPVSCTGGTGTIRCTTPRGLDPGEQMAFMFSLGATPDAVSGQVTGSVNAGVSIVIRLAPIRIIVRLLDAVDVLGGVYQLGPWRARVYLTARNTGRSSGQVIVTMALPVQVHADTMWTGCRHVDGGVQCTATLAPGKHADWQVVLSTHEPVQTEATVTAVLGTARAETTVPLYLQPTVACLGSLMCSPP